MPAKFNRVISLMIMSDFVVTTSASLLIPIFALFITQQIRGGTPEVVGFAIAIYWIVKSVLQLPVARFIDHTKGDADDYHFMLCGLFLGGVIALLYYFAREVWHVYALQVLYGIADACAVPPFYALFTRHIDKGSEGFEWSIQSSIAFGGGSALGGALGGVLLGLVGYSNIFLIVSCMYFLSCLMLLFLRPRLIPETPLITIK